MTDDHENLDFVEVHDDDFDSPEPEGEEVETEAADEQTA